MKAVRLLAMMIGLQPLSIPGVIKKKIVPNNTYPV